jgi:poly(A) polymerase
MTRPSPTGHSIDRQEDSASMNDPNPQLHPAALPANTNTIPAVLPASSGIGPHSIARERHSISRKDISPSALRVLYRLREAGYGAFLVGGAVRDLLLGMHPKDFDVATDATPEQVKHLFRNCRLIGRRFRLAHVVYGREIIEVATFRANSDDGSGDRELGDEGRVLRDNVYGSIEDDAVRRDFTVNALYYAIEDFSVRDYVGGFDDVMQRVLKLIGDPQTRYREDPVRMLRAVRLAAKLDFRIDAATAEPLPRLAGLLQEAAPARLFEECLKLFLSGHAEASFLGLEANGLLSALFPETAAALASNRSGALRRMLLQGLRNTDARIATDEPVSPAFLFALLLWPAYCRTLAMLQAQGMHAVDAERRAADRVTLHQVATVALPRRFSLPMQEIWLLQPRFSQRQRRRVVRMLAHPRFRAAFDFLQLRLAASDSHAADVAFWAEAQHDPDHAIALVPSPETEADGESEGASSSSGRLRRRRRRRAPGPNGQA